MININDIKQQVDYISNTWQSDIPGIDEFNNLVYRAAVDFIDDRVELFENNQSSLEDLAQLKDTQKLKFVNGVSSKPEGYVYPTMLMLKQYSKADKDCENSPTEKYIEVKIKKDAEINFLLGSKIKPPTLKYPYASVDRGFKIYPKNIKSAELTYIKLPQQPKWAFTLQNDIEVFDDVNSVHLDLPEKAFEAIVSRVLVYIGINTKEGDLVNYGKSSEL